MSAVLRGISWGHSRGITPLLAASQRYEELHKDVRIEWKKRSLQEFADFPIEKLTEQYDLLIIDHPWVGCAAATRCVLPLNEYLPVSYLEEQAKHSVGYSHLSYFYDGAQWALAIDAATPAASYRKDLLEDNNAAIPDTWESLIELAKRGKVAVPAIPIDLLMNFYSFCIAHGEYPFQSEQQLIDLEVGVKAINSMKELYSNIHSRFFECNPIAVAELMTQTNDYWYCPFAYGYSNYSRIGYASKPLHYCDVISINGERLKTTIGGTGLAVSAFSKYKGIAVDFASWIVSPEMQRTFYMQHGGQPGHRKAWLDEAANELTSNFFSNVLPVMDNGYVRPRYNGYLYFQDHAGLPLQECLLNNSDPVVALEKMNWLYQQSIIRKQSIVAV
jgi:multiple sugar transport system substrate-binding protein